MGRRRRSTRWRSPPRRPKNIGASRRPRPQARSSTVTEPLKQRIADTIAKGRVMLFMKGNPSMPQCGFSAAVVGMLKEVGVPFGSYNILADQELREGLKEY